MKQKSILILAILLVKLSIFSQELKFSFDYTMPEILETDAGQQLNYPGALFAGIPGEPELPLITQKVLLPPGTEISGAEAVGVTFFPALDNIQLTLFPQLTTDEKDLVFDNTKGNEENQIIQNLSTEFYRGYSIAYISFCPVIYDQETRTLKPIKKLEISINSGTSENALQSLKFVRDDASTISKLNSMVDDISALDSYPKASGKFFNETDMLIITADSLMEAFAEYAHWENMRGYITEIISTEEIENNYPGTDSQEKIRNCIIDYYQNQNLQYMILGGDSDPHNGENNIIEHRGMWGHLEGVTTTDDVPNDMYFACLDGNWDNNGNGIYGEEGESDLLAEVFVGRICVDNATEIQNLTHKIMMYQDYPVIGDVEKATMIGEELNNNPYTWGGDYKNEVANGSIAHGYYTEGFTENFEIEKLYDKTGGWSSADLFQNINENGTNLLNYIGHCSVTGAMRLQVTNINTQTITNDGINRGFIFGYTQGCYAGSFDNKKSGVGYSEDDSFAEEITTIETGMVSLVANSRYGVYAVGSTNAPSQFLDRKYFDALFGEDITTAGEALAYAREEMIPYINQYVHYRWCAYTSHLFGAPNMDLFTASPQNIVANHEVQIDITAENFTVETNTPGARIALSQNGILLGRAVAGSNGNATLELINQIQDDEPVQISIIAHNKFRYAAELSIYSENPYIIFNQFMINDENGNNNGLTDYDENIELGLSLINLSNLASNSEVNVVLSSEDEFITITDNTENFGVFDGNEVVEIADAFSIEIRNDVPTGHKAHFTVTATGNETWESLFEMEIMAPELIFVNVEIDDVECGNGNGYPDPGENISMVYTIENSGTSASQETTAELFCNSQFINLLGTSENLPSIAPAENLEIYFELEVETEIPYYTPLQFDISIAFAGYTFNHQFAVPANVLIEDWEYGNLFKFPWEAGGNAGWEIAEEGAYAGGYAAKAGAISLNQSSELTLDINVLDDDSISFYRKLDINADFHVFEFYIDYTKKASWTGTQDWEKVTYPISQGEHTLKWKFKKGFFITDDDVCMIDNIIFPLSDLEPVPPTFISESQVAVTTIYPNPARSEVIITSSEELKSLDIFTLNGVYVKTEPGSGKYLSFNVTDLKAGIYLIKISTEKDVVHKKLIVE